jgi:hypothetical protein
MRQLLTGVLLVTGAGTTEGTGAEVRHLLLFQGMQMFALLLGGLLAGGGQRNGLVLGAVVGVWNGVLSVLLRQHPTAGVSPVALYGMPLLQAAVGAVGGWFGSLIWKPLPSDTIPAPPTQQRKTAKGRRKSPFAGPVAWVRVLVGAALAVAGTLSAAVIFQKVLAISGGTLSTSDALQDWLITWEIKVLAVILGGAVAGATTSNGLKQGLAVGLGASAILIGLQFRVTDRPLEMAAFTGLSSLSLALLGGWFGGQLFPPLIKSRRGRFGPSAFT